MCKCLEDMSNAELWQLFPIVLTEYQPQWKPNYLMEKTVIEKAIGREAVVRISHFGSTSVPGLLAKPTIDILLEIREDTDVDILVSNLRSAGYIPSLQPEKPAPHLMFMKGYTPHGFEGQAYHLHVRYPGDYDELYFRDYLVSHPDAAAEYGRLKRELQRQYRHDRDGYTAAKGEFIRKVTMIAREEQEQSL